jgi:erythromycin esterase
MKKLIPSLCALILILNPALNRVSGQTAGFNIMLLDRNTHRVATVDDMFAGFADLGFLKKTLKDADIVFLGEQNHGDGTTFEAKSRLVRFLHEEMDFDVLAFESSITDCYLTWQEILAGADPMKAAGKSIFRFWAESRFTTDLFSYLGTAATGEDPLILAGFDIQPSGLFQGSDNKEQIIKFLAKGPESVRLEHLPHLAAYLDQPLRFMGPQKNLEVDSAYRAALTAEFAVVAGAWEQQPWSPDEAPLYRFFVNTPRWLFFVWNLDFTQVDPAIANIRDEEMAKNLIWLKEQVYPDRKIIVWGASSHFGFNRDRLQPFDGMVPTGNYVKDRFGDKSYMISFTSFDGETGSLYDPKRSPVPRADSLSLEQALQSLGITYGYLDMRSPKVRKALGERFIARLYGYENWSGEWARMTDGIFFIRTMEPNELR